MGIGGGGKERIVDRQVLNIGCDGDRMPSVHSQTDANIIGGLVQMNISSTHTTEIYDPASHASLLYERIQENVETVRAELKEDEELFAFYNAPSGEVIKIESFGYHNPYLMIIYGEDQQMNKCQILVHAYSFQIVMKVLKIQIQNQNQRRAIGFLGDITQKSESDQEQ
jgi:hypothetical protein